MYSKPSRCICMRHYIIQTFIFFLCICSVHAVITDGLIAYYPMESSTIDALGSFNGTNYNVSYNVGKIGLAGNFSPTMLSKVVFENGSYNNLTSFSICAWVTSYSQGSDRAIFQIGGTPIDFDQYKIGINYGGNIFTQYMAISNDSSDRGYPFSCNGGSWSSGQWKYVCGVLDYSNNASYLYIDSTLECTDDMNMNNLSYTFQNFTRPTKSGLGHDFYYDDKPPSDYWDGLMDEVLIYDRVLTNAEILYLYANGSGYNMSQSLINGTVPNMTIISGTGLSIFGFSDDVDRTQNNVTWAIAIGFVCIALLIFGYYLFQYQS